MTPSELECALREGFPLARPELYRVDEASPSTLRVSRRTDAVDLRPGGIIAGPVLMDLADTAAWLHTMARHGRGAGPSVTSDLAIHFLAPARGELCAVCTHDVSSRTGERFTVRLHDAAGPVALAHVGYALRREVPASDS